MIGETRLKVAAADAPRCGTCHVRATAMKCQVGDRWIGAWALLRSPSDTGKTYAGPRSKIQRLRRARPSPTTRPLLPHLTREDGVPPRHESGLAPAWLLLGGVLHARAMPGLRNAGPSPQMQSRKSVVGGKR